MADVALTGATGTVGGMAARLLADAGVPMRLLVRDPSRAPDLPGAEVLRAEYGGDACRAALTGVDTALMVSAHESADRVEVHRAFVQAAVDAGVRQVVYLSFVGAGSGAGFLLARDHGATEQILRDSGLAFTFLRDSFYAEAIAGFAGDDGAIRGPAGDGRVAAVSQRDVAAVAAHILADPRPHANRGYDLTGPEALTLGQIAATLTEVTGRPHRFVDETMDEARASRAVYDAPAWLVDAWISTYTAIRDGELEHVSDAVPTLLGRPALRYSEAMRAAIGDTA
ncbi:SDR family oxidoreductase [Tomitella fengzijianii]|uniref:SDR family oxidoreductase n=1 Tax=Tomitella fengzijianii TaxID=2597660 RepID=UPI00131B20E9|nr:SDR family oxidoreductase [Tomitella fengzijianii]